MKYFFPILLTLSSVFLYSCDDDDHDHDEDNKITITIEEPLDGAVITDCSSVHIHITVEASDENHEFEVKLHPEGDTSDEIIDFDMHDHDKVLTFDQDIDLCSYPAGTCFHLEVEACIDHDCEKQEKAEVEFCLQ